MAKRYYNLERETKEYLKYCSNNNITPSGSIKSINDSVITQKALGTWRSWTSLLVDSDVAAFIAASGATDTTVTAQLIAYLKAQSLWTSCRFFPFKSAQNKGTGSTVYGLGGWTSNNITLYNSPTWGTTGVAFDATDDRGSVSLIGIEGLSELYSFDVQKPLGASLADTFRYGVWTIGDANPNSIPTDNRILYSYIATSGLTGEIIAIGSNIKGQTNRRLGTSSLTWSSGEKTQLVARFAASGSAMWKSKTAGNMNLSTGTQDFSPSSIGWVADSILNLGCQISNGSPSALFTATTRVALLLCKTSLTQIQRETITDYLDLL